jgi:hypothetical protein
MMPKIAEIREIDGWIWARVEMRDGSPIQFLTSDEIDKNRERELHQLDEIERLRAALQYIANSAGCGCPCCSVAERLALEALNQQTTRYECETCKDDPIACASIPLRQCAKAER